MTPEYPLEKLLYVILDEKHKGKHEHVSTGAIFRDGAMFREK